MNNSARTAEPGKGTWPSWTTPPAVLDRLRSMGRVALDPCSNAASIVDAAESWCEGGLERPWSHRGGFVYVNPPYGRELAPWTAKMAAEAKLGVEIVALLPAATGPRWFHENVSTADVILFWRGRLKFGNPPPSGASSSTFDNMLVYWGKRPVTFIEAFGRCGVIAVPG